MTEEENCVLEFVSGVKLSLLGGCIIQALEGVFFAMARHLTATFCLVLCSLAFQVSSASLYLSAKLWFPTLEAALWSSKIVLTTVGQKATNSADPGHSRVYIKESFGRKFSKTTATYIAFLKLLVCFYFFPWPFSVLSAVFFHEALLSCRRKKGKNVINEIAC